MAFNSGGVLLAVLLAGPLGFFARASQLPAGTPVLEVRASQWPTNINGTAIPQVPRLKVGAALSLRREAKFSSLGNALKNSYEIFFDWLNNEKGGLLVGGARHFVDLVMIDDWSDKARVADIIEYLSEVVKVDFFLGPYSSGLTAAAAPVAQNANKVMVAPVAGLSSIFVGQDLIFGTLQAVAGNMKAAFAALASVAGAGATVSVMEDDVAYTRAMCSSAPERAAEHGMSVVQQLVVDPDMSAENMTRTVAEIAGVGADILVGCVYRPTCHSFLKEAKAQKYNPKAIVFSICVTEPDFFAELGDASLNVMGLTPWTSDLVLQSSLTNWTVKSFVSAYESKSGQAPPYQAASAFAASAALVHAIEKANDTNSSAVARALSDMSEMSVYGGISFDEHGQSSSALMLVQQQDRFRPKVVYPLGAGASIVYPRPALSDEDCPEGQVFLDILGSCACRAGFSFEGGNCISCGPGNHTSTPGSNACQMCEPGRFTAEWGATGCGLCGVGTYEPGYGGRECTSCGALRTTLVRGAANLDACVCRSGYYLPVVGGECEPCPVGMSCAAGSEMAALLADEDSRGTGTHPLVEPGFMTMASDPLTVYRCLQTNACPGGHTAMCAPHRDTTAVACAICVDGAYMSGKECKVCAPGQDVMPIVLMVLLGIAGLAVMTFVVNRSLLMQTNATLMCVVTVALLFTGLQTLGIFQQVAISWFEPMASILELSSLLSFNLEVLKMSCVVGSNPVTNFLYRQLVAPLTIPVIILSLFFKKHFQANTRISVELVNTVGSIFNVFYISIVLSGISPMVCYRHPPYEYDSLTSMMTAPAVLCWEGSMHTSMMVIGIFALFIVPVPFFAMATVFTWKYPKYVATGHPHLHAMRFLFFRVHASKYYYSLILLVRSLVICLVPIIPGLSGDTALQTWVMAAVICTFMLIQQQLNPWRSYAANILDGVISCTLLLLLITGVMATDLRANMDSIKVVGLLAFIIFIVIVAGSLVVGLYLKFRPTPYYHYFICHHKGQAAAQARLLKVLIQARTRLSVFIDSDDLQELDTLFDIVKTKLSNLVVYLTRETLSRPWCAGEITTAFNSKRVKVTAVKTPSFVAPTAEQMGDLDSYLDLTSCSLEEYNIPNEAVAEAFNRLLHPDTHCLHLQASIPGSKKFDLLTAEILGTPAASAAQVDVLPPIPPKSFVLISSLPHNDEAAASAYILDSKVREDVLRLGEDGTCLMMDHDQSLEGISASVARCRAGIIMLSAGTMECLPQLVAIVELMNTVAAADTSPPAVIPINTPGFVFPNAGYYEEVLPRIWRDSNHAEAAATIQSFFKRIAIFFATNASDHVINTQATEVVSRVQPKFDTKVAMRRQSTVVNMGGKDGEEDGGIAAGFVLAPNFTPEEVDAEGTLLEQHDELECDVGDDPDSFAI